MTPRRKKDFQEHRLSRRERQIMQAVYRSGRATVAQVVDAIPDPPTPDSIRRMCHILEEKGHLRSKTDGKRRVYRPTVDAGKAKRTALDNMLDTFFAGSAHQLVATLLDAKRDQLSAEDIERLSRMIEEAEEESES